MMKNFKLKALAITLIATITSGCSFHVDRGDTVNTLYENTQMAKEVCGGDNVKSVTLDGFKCQTDK